MPDIMETATRNQERAKAIIRQTGIMDIWASIGARVNLVGSLRTGLLMKHRDIDLHVYSDPLTLKDSFAAMAQLAENPAIQRIECVNLMPTEEQCIEWHALYNENGEEWQLDIIHIQKGSEYDGYFELVADRIRNALTPETKLAILNLKNQTPDHEKIMGIEYCQAVIQDGVRTYQEFMQWRAAHPAAGIVRWMP